MGILFYPEETILYVCGINIALIIVLKWKIQRKQNK